MANSTKRKNIDLKSIYHNSIFFFIVTLFLCSCDNAKKIETSNFLGNYERDMFIPTDTTDVTYRNENDKSAGWIISLKTENQFTFRGTAKKINGFWCVDKKDGDNYFLKFAYQSDTLKGRLNGTRIDFDGPYRLFDSLFRGVTFVQTTRRIE